MFVVALLANTRAGAQSVPEVKEAQLGSTRNVHACGTLYLAGQPSQQDLQTVKGQGIQRVVSLREEGEVQWDDAAAVKQAGMTFVRVPFSSADTLTDEVFDQIRKLLQDTSTPTLLHCGAANRVGAVWLTYRVLDQKVPLAKALEEARTIGLRTAALEEKARAYIEKRQ
jgi:uncharacterized protein (TIGR01244 family)